MGYYDAPDPYIFYCEVSEGSSEDCDHAPTECVAAEPCEYCGGISYCRCDDDYEAWKESQWDD